MSVRCLACGECVYRGKIFNARKETVTGEDYLGLAVFRFYVRCPRCTAEFIIKTVPKDFDYTVEVGATRDLQPWEQTKA